MARVCSHGTCVSPYIENLRRVPTAGLGSSGPPIARGNAPGQCNTGNRTLQCRLVVLHQGHPWCHSHTYRGALEGNVGFGDCMCNAATYNTLMNAAAGSFGDEKLKEKRLQIGLDAFDRLQKDPDCQPTSVSYSTYFKFLRLVLSSRSPMYLRLLKYGFDKCCEQGCLSSNLLKQLNSAPEKEAKYIFEGNYENRRSLRTCRRNGPPTPDMDI